jgi:thiol:disulfide interchange protein
LLLGCGAAAEAPVLVTIAPAPAPPAGPPAAPARGAPEKRASPATGSVVWERAEFDARARARREGRPLLVYLRADWSAGSLWMEREVWSDARVASAARAFVALALDVTSAEGDAELYAQRYGANKLPTVALFDREGRRVASLSGEQPVEALLAALSAADP